MAPSGKHLSPLRIGRKVWLLDEENGSSECEKAYVITGVCKVPGRPPPSETSSQSSPAPFRGVTSIPDLSLSKPASNADQRAFSDLQRFTASVTTDSLPPFPCGPTLIRNVSSSSSVDVLPLPPAIVPDAACSSLAWHQRSPLPGPDPPRIYLHSILDAYQLRPRQPSTDAISSREPPSFKADCSLSRTKAIQTGSLVYMITPECSYIESAQPNRGTSFEQQSPMQRSTHSQVDGHNPPFTMLSMPESSILAHGYPATQLKPIRYRPGHILRVSGNWDERIVSRVYVRAGQTFYDLLGEVAPFPRAIRQTHDGPNDDDGLAHSGDSTEITTPSTRSRLQKPRQPLTMTMSSLQAHTAELLSSQDVPAEYHCYPERKLRRFRGDTTTLGEVGEIGKMGRNASGILEKARGNGEKAEKVD